MAPRILNTSALAGGEWSASRTDRYTPGTHWTGGWMDPRDCLAAVAKRKSPIISPTEN
jgi:hypothetical protein